MTSLDNFHTGNKPGLFHPTMSILNRNIIKGLNYPSEWDIQNKVPVGPFQPTCDTALRLTNRPDPTLTEKRDQNTHRLFVPTRPYTRKIQGDNVESAILMQDKQNPHPGPNRGTTTCPFMKMQAYMRNLVPIHTSNIRFKPY